MLVSQLLSQFTLFKIGVYLSDSGATTHLHGATILMRRFK